MISYRYDEFGTDPSGNQGQLQPFGYTGYQRDTVSGTYYAQAREYDAWSGRFTSEDVVKGSVTYPETLNAYGYCWGNPVKFVDRDGQSPILVGILVAGILGIVIDLGFQTVDNVKNGEKWYDYNLNEACIAGTGAMLGTVVFMAAPTIATAIVGAGASAGMIGAVTIGVVAVGNFVVGASMSVLSDYMANVDKNQMLKNAIISGVSSAIFSMLLLGWEFYNHSFEPLKRTIEYDLFGLKYDKYGLEGFYKQCLKEDLTKFLIFVYGYDMGSAIAQTILEDIVKEEEECPD